MKSIGETGRIDSELGWHLGLLLLLSAGYESLFLHHGLNRIDEGWMLYAARQLHEGERLYRDVFFGYPPGQLLPAWLGVYFDPPGVIGARVVNGAFATAMVVALYWLGRCIMPARFALLGASLLAVAAPRAHLWHFVFGYRFLVFSALALLAFWKRMESEDARWMLLAGALVGVAAGFRLEPAMASGVALALGVVAAGGGWRRWLRDWSLMGLGMLGVLVPLSLYLAAYVDLAFVWGEIVVRPVSGVGLQSLPMPDLSFPRSFSRDEIAEAFMAFQFRFYPLLFVVYAVSLVFSWLRTRLAGREFEQAFLLVVVVWGGIYLTRAYDRADGSHLEMVLPGPCILLAHALYRAVSACSKKRGEALRGRGRLAAVSCVAAFFLWVALSGSDRGLRSAWRGTSPFQSLGGEVYARSPRWTATLDRAVEVIRARTDPTQPILDLSSSPILYVLSERRAAGHHDVFMPGTFLDEAEEIRAIEALRRDPPALVVWPEHPFDGMESRAVNVLAPKLARWVADHYQFDPETTSFFLLLVPRDPDAGR